MRGKRTLIALLIGAFAPIAGADTFNSLDANADGRLDRRELVSGTLFQRLDGDANGRLSASEFAGAPHWHRDWDADGDFKLSEDEFYWAAFREADADRDQGLAETEYASLRQRLEAR